MKTLHALVALVGATLATATPAAAQALGQGIPFNRGTKSNEVALSGAVFLEIPVGAREAALAGSATASTQGLTALYWNTAAAADIQTVSGTVSRADLFGNSGLRHSYAAVGIPFGGANLFGLSLSYFTSGDIERTTEAFPEGGDPGAGGTVRFDGYAAGLHLARRLTDRLSVGVAGKYVTEGVEFARARWFAADLSTQFRTGIFATTLGASVQNVGSSAKWSGSRLEQNILSARDVFPTTRDIRVTYRMQEVQLPTAVQFAAATEVLGGEGALYSGLGPTHGLTLNAAVSDGFDRAIQPVLGVEYRFRNIVAARLGKRFYAPEDGPWSTRYGLAGGVGLSFPVLNRRFTFDYASSYLSTSELPATQSFTVQFGY